MDTDADRRAPGDAHQPDADRVITTYPDGSHVAYSTSWSDESTNATTYGTAHGETCPKCQALADALLPSRQPEGRA